MRRLSREASTGSGRVIIHNFISLPVTPGWMLAARNSQNLTGQHYNSHKWTLSPQPGLEKVLGCERRPSPIPQPDTDPLPTHPAAD